MWRNSRKSSLRWKPESRKFVTIKSHWIPAFAGMTEIVQKRLFTRLSYMRSLLQPFLRFLPEAFLFRADFFLFYSLFDGLQWNGGRYPALSRPIQFDESIPKSFKGELSIVGLGTMFCGNHRHPWGEVLEADRGFDFILPLTSRSAGPIGLNDDLLFKDFEVGIKVLSQGVYSF